MIETLIPTHLPDVSKARRVSFKSQEDLKADREADIEKIEKKEAYRQRVILKVRFNNWSRKRLTQVKKVRLLRDQLNEAIKLLEEIDNAKPSTKINGETSLVEIPVFTQSRNAEKTQQANREIWQKS